MASIQYAIFALLVCAVAAQVTRPGACPTQSVVNPFDISRYLGKWYEVEAYFQFYSNNGICVSANYSDNGDGTVKVYNLNFNANTLEPNYIIGSARPTNGTSGQLGVTFPVAPAEAPYWVLDTDYDNYSVVWSCTNLGLLHFETAWFLSRERQPASIVQDQVRAIFNERGINTDDLRQTRQYDCPQEPEPPVA